MCINVHSSLVCNFFFQDWSDRNKFSSLQFEEEENGSDVENKDSENEDK